METNNRGKSSIGWFARHKLPIVQNAAGKNIIAVIDKKDLMELDWTNNIIVYVAIQ
jgi:hypothetical protein